MFCTSDKSLNSQGRKSPLVLEKAGDTHKQGSERLNHTAAARAGFGGRPMVLLVLLHLPVLPACCWCWHCSLVHPLVPVHRHHCMRWWLCRLRRWQVSMSGAGRRPRPLRLLFPTTVLPLILIASQADLVIFSPPSAVAVTVITIFKAATIAMMVAIVMMVLTVTIVTEH